MSQTATLTYDLTDPDARDAFALACKAPDLLRALLEFDQYLHDQVKYHERKDQHDVEQVRHRFLSLMRDNDIKLH